jgi:hypothetical protein
MLRFERPTASGRRISSISVWTIVLIIFFGKNMPLTRPPAAPPDAGDKLAGWARAPLPVELAGAQPSPSVWPGQSPATISPPPRARAEPRAAESGSSPAARAAAGRAGAHCQPWWRSPRSRGGKDGGAAVVSRLPNCSLSLP